MSNQKFRLPSCRFVFAILWCGSFWLSATIALGQSEGFSIFESPSEDTAPTVSPQEAFTNPAALLPKTQFGKFDNRNFKAPEPLGLMPRTVPGCLNNLPAKLH